MEKKRWIAVGVAGALFLLSAISSGIGVQETTQSQLDDLNQMIAGSDELSETIIEAGDTQQKIVQLEVDGTIVAGGTSIWGEGYDHQLLLDSLDQIKEDETVKGVFLKVNSPGGGVYESAEIARKLDAIKTERQIPIYVSMENMAASGGYYISAGADKIFATEETTTGSIGVIMSGTNYSGLLEKLGIEDTTVKSGKLKDMGSSTRPETKEDHEVLQTYIDRAYDRFVKIVATGRHMSEEDVRKIADGRIYDGGQAQENGLVDELGFPDEALAALRQDKQLENAELISYETAGSDFARSWLGMQLKSKGQSAQLLQFLENAGSLEASKAMYLYGGE